MKTLGIYIIIVLAVVISGCGHETLIAPLNTKLAAASIKSSFPSLPSDIPITSTAASSTTSGWPSGNTIDGSLSTSWSSLTKASNHIESFNFHFGGFHNVNYVRLTPRFSSGSTLGFPVTFNIYYSTGSSWVLISSYTSFPTPNSVNSLPVVLPLPSTVNADGIEITATQLGKDDVNNYVFQLAEVAAGYLSDFEVFKFVSNDGASMVNKIKHVGSSSFNPNKITNLTPDERSPIIVPNAGSKRNIYAPNIVYNNGAWNVYFGGWDGINTETDQINITVSLDTFATFNPHALMISHGSLSHVNNESVMKRPDGTWLMTYTSVPIGGKNKPTYSNSSNGITWIPNSGSTNYTLQMTNYPDWVNADVNGSNVVYLENGLYHLYFFDFAPGHTRLIHHATSTDNINYSYIGDVNLFTVKVANDVKKFTYSGNNYYLMVSHFNDDDTYYSLSNSLNAFPNDGVLFEHLGSGDLYITSIGIVTANNRLYGYMYGAGPVSALNQNMIFARWLTKKVVFISDATGVKWGDTGANGPTERAHGPNQVYLYMNTNIETGHFYIYDTDGSTLLYTSPQVTMRSGDIWNYTN